MAAMKTVVLCHSTSKSSAPLTAWLLISGCALPSLSLGTPDDSAQTSGSSSSDDGHTGAVEPGGDEHTGSTGSADGTDSGSTGTPAETCEGLPASIAGECSVYAQDCPECYRCSWVKQQGILATTDFTECVLETPVAALIGDACEIDAGGGDNCESGSFCYPPNTYNDAIQPRCVAFCDDAEGWTCSQPGTACAPPVGGAAVNGAFGCFPTCDPLASSCGPGESCLANIVEVPGFVCQPDVFLQSAYDAGDPCPLYSAFDCQPGQVCSSPAYDVDIVCNPYCDTTDPASDDLCRSLFGPESRCMVDCVSWNPAAGFENVGTCFTPTPDFCRPPEVDPAIPWCSPINGSEGANGTWTIYDGCTQYLGCFDQCEDIGGCPVPTTGTATPVCADPAGLGQNSCALACDGGEVCPDGMVCEANSGVCAFEFAIADCG